PCRARGPTAGETASRVGSVSPGGIRYAGGLREDTPESLRVAAQEPFGARALIYALLLDPRPDLRARQQALLQAGSPPRDPAETMRHARAVPGLPGPYRLPPAHPAMPALLPTAPTPP